MYLCMSWNLLSRTGWSQVHGDPPVSVSQVLGLKFCATRILTGQCGLAGVGMAFLEEMCHCRERI